MGHLAGMLTSAAADPATMHDSPTDHSRTLDAAESLVDDGRGADAIVALAALSGDTSAPQEVRTRARVLGARTAARLYDLASMSAFVEGADEFHDPSLALLAVASRSLLGEADGTASLVAEATARLDGPLPAEEMRFVAETIALAIARTGHGDDLFEVMLRLSGAAHEAGLAGLVTSLLVAEAAHRSRADLAGARLTARRAVDLAERDDDLRNLPFALAQLATAEAGLGDEACFGSAERLAAFGAPAAVLVAEFARGLHAVTVGDDESALARFTLVHRRFDGDITAPVSWHGELVELAQRSGDLTLARRVSAGLRELTLLGPIPWLLASADRCEGILADDLRDGATRFAAAVDRFTLHGYAIAAGRTHLARARASARWGVDPTSSYSSARAAFTAAGMVHWARRCG